MPFRKKKKGERKEGKKVLGRLPLGGGVKEGKMVCLPVVNSSPGGGGKRERKEIKSIVTAADTLL